MASSAVLSGKAKGSYAAENIDSESNRKAAGRQHEQAVAAKTAICYVDVPTMMARGDQGATLIARRACADKPVSAMGLSTRTSASPRTFKGKTVAITPGGSMDADLAAVQKKTGLKESDFNTVACDGQTKIKRSHKRAGRSVARLRSGTSR